MGTRSVKDFLNIQQWPTKHHSNPPIAHKKLNSSVAKKKNPEKSKNQYVLKTMPTSSLFSRQNRVKQINSYCKTKESFISASILKEKIMQDQKKSIKKFYSQY